jgi:hypothetical protein
MDAFGKEPLHHYGLAFSVQLQSMALNIFLKGQCAHGDRFALYADGPATVRAAGGLVQHDNTPRECAGTLPLVRAKIAEVSTTAVCIDGDVKGGSRL